MRHMMELSKVLLAVTAVLQCLYGKAKAEEKLEPIPEDNHVLVLGKDNIKRAVTENDFVLVEFYAPWCGHCQQFEPVYNGVAKTLKDSGSTIRLAKVDATVERELAQELNIGAFPTFKFYKKGKVREYTGSRVAEDMIAWLKKKSGPIVVELLTKEDVDNFLEESEIGVIGFFTDKGAKPTKAFIEAAEDVTDAIFGIVYNQDLYKEMDAAKNDIIMYSKFRDPEVFEDEIKEKAIIDFVLANFLPLIIDYNPGKLGYRISKSPLKKHLIIFDSKEKLDSYEEDLKHVAKRFKKQLLVVRVDVNRADAAHLMQFFEVDQNVLPKIVLYDGENKKKYLTSLNELDSDKMIEFVEEVLAGKVPESLRSQEIPEDWDKNPVKILVSKNFHEVVMDKSKDVFVFFSSPHCSHCQQMSATWDELGEKLKNDDSKVIAKIDGTVNEIKDFRLHHYPTLNLYKKDTNEVVEYKGNRNVDSFIKFLNTGEQVWGDANSPSNIYKKPSEDELADTDYFDYDFDEDEEEEGDEDEDHEGDEGHAHSEL